MRLIPQTKRLLWILSMSWWGQNLPVQVVHDASDIGSEEDIENFGENKGK